VIHPHPLHPPAVLGRAAIMHELTWAGRRAHGDDAKKYSLTTFYKE